MRKYLTILVGCLALCACDKGSGLDESTSFSKSNEFVQGGVHFTVIDSCPTNTITKATDESVSFTVVGEKGGETIKLYTIDTETAPDFITSETYFDDGTLLSTAIIYKGAVLDYEVSASLLESFYENYPETKSLKSWWSNYKKCVMESAEEMSENLLDNPFDRATCEWIPCETIIVVVSAFNCLVGND